MDQRADLFALGAILYELLSGVRAFSRETAPETMAAILNLDPPDLSTAAAALPPGLVRIVSRCLEKNPSDRFQTASDLAFALDSLSNASGVSTTTPAVTRRRVHAGVARLGRRCVAAGDAGARCVSARPRAACPAQPDALPDFPDRRIRRAGKFRPVSGRPSPGIRGARLRWDRASLDPGHGFARSPPSSRFGDRRPGHAGSVLVARRTVRRVRRRREAQEAGCVGRSAADLVRSAAWECRRGRLVEP